MFWFLLVALVAAVAAVALIVVGSGDGTGHTARGGLPEAVPDRAADQLPAHRPLRRADIEELRLPTALRGYRMAEVDEVLDRLGAELAQREARIAELESSLAGVQASAMGRADLFPGTAGPSGEGER